MKRISFNSQFVNEAGNDLIPGKIHTIRQNYEYWKKFEGKELALFTWEGKPYQKGSKQKVFCVKRLISVQEVYMNYYNLFFKSREDCINGNEITGDHLAENDGFEKWSDCVKWFCDYPPGELAILHFTDFRY